MRRLCVAALEFCSTHVYLAAIGVMLYALYTYHWRAAAIRRGHREPYDDRLGPVRCERVIRLFVAFISGADYLAILITDDSVYCTGW